MAEKETKDDDKIEKVEKEEQPLTVVTDDTPEKKAAADEGSETGDAEDGDGEGAEDERLGASDEEIVDAEKDKDERRGERRSRNKKRREWGDKMVRENRYLSIRNEQLERQAAENARRLDSLESSTVDGRINQFKAAISKADDTIADAITRRDGEAHKEASRIRDDLRDGLSKLEVAKERQTKRSEEGDGGKMDPVVLERTKEWAERNKWFGKDEEDTAIVKAVDDRLQAEGVYDPRQSEYWTELDKRLTKYLPHRLKKGRANGRADDMNDDEDDDRDLEAANEERGGRKNERDTRNGNGNGRDRSDTARRGGPKFRSGGGERQLGPNEVYLSKDRIQAMQDAGFEEGSEQWNSMLKRYKQFDSDKDNAA